MSPTLILSLIAAYFILLIVIAKLTATSNDNQAFFLGNRQSPWYVVAFGMIGTSLSGVTFISVPGWVESSQFSYMQMVLGYLVGYFVIATVLMPLYYRLQLTSIYSYFQDRFGRVSYKTAAACFLISRLVGAAFRLFLVAVVLNYAVFDQLGIEVPFFVTVLVTIGLIWLYTSKGGIKTIIWTDTLQTAFMLLAVGTTIYIISAHFNWGVFELIEEIGNSKYSQIFFFEDVKDSRFFFKNFIGGAFISIVMTGMDQDMMQKNLSCKSIGEAQKNMFWFSIVLVFVNLLFLALGALLYMYAQHQGMTLPEKADELYPMIALNGGLGIVVGVFFLLGLIAAAYSSADSALTALTTSFCVDFLDIEKRSKEVQLKWRKWVHVSISLVLAVIIMIFSTINEESVISELFKAAGYTYGPLLGLFSFGLLTQRTIKDKYTLLIAIVAPLLTYVIASNAHIWLGGYQMGFELILVNGLLMFLGLFFISNSKKTSI